VEWKSFEYTCEAGAKLTVHLRNQTAKVVFKDEVYLTKQVISGSGTRYSDGKVVWWSKGEGGFLQEDSPDGDGKMMVKGCQLNKPMNGEAASGSVTGTVSYLVCMALPPEALIEVQLQDASLADAPAKTIAQEKITLGEHQVPIPFELKFDPAKIDLRHAYSVSARILVDGEVRFIADRSYRVLTQGNPTHVEMILKGVPPVSPRNP
jgi:putative lipoprotein